MKIAVAMSGGVDSSTALALLKQQGHDLVGLTLRMVPCEAVAEKDGRETRVPLEDGRPRCCTTRDIRDAAGVARSQGVPHRICDARESFEEQVVTRFLDDYEHGLTPNPCVECNRHAKLPLLIREALADGCEKLATGHYARLEPGRSGGRWTLRKAVDPDKDQSYFLHRLTQEMLSRLLFPLGETTKAQVREIASRLGLAVAAKPESMEICFVPGDDYRNFVKVRRPRAFVPGDIVDTAGRVVGRHEGVAGYTVGQRRGLGLSGGPWYVVELRPEDARVIVSSGEEPRVEEFRVGDLVWSAWEGLNKAREANVKVRYRAQDEPVVLHPDSDGTVRVVPKRPLTSVTPGQSAVFYDGDAVAGGGIILKS